MNRRNPPKALIRFFRWYCREDLVDAIEGDLLELYSRHLATRKTWKANLFYFWNVLRFCQPIMIKKRNRNTQKSSTMWKNHFKIALRLMKRQKAYALTNIVGLSLGITASLFLFLYVTHELSYDSFHEGADDIYQVNAISFNPEANFYRQAVPAPVADYLKNTFPEVVASAKLTRTRFPDNLFRVDSKEYFETGVFLADAGLFDVFSFSLLMGDEKNALSEPNQVILTQSMAKKYFGDTDAIGEVINYENLAELQVTGVIQDPPSNSSIQFNFLISNTTPKLFYYDDWLNDWGSSTTGTFVKLIEGTEASVSESKFPDIVNSFMLEDLDDDEEYVMSMQPIQTLHFEPHITPDLRGTNSNKRYSYVIPLIGVFILLIAAFNYVNLTTARMTDRLKEVGVRKVVGSSRKNLRSQFLVETMTTAVVSLLISVVFLVLLLEPFNVLTGKSLVFDDLINPRFGALVVGTGLFIGLLSGIYPALVLSKIRPIKALQKGAVSMKRGGFRNVLLVIQFAAAFSMITATLVVNQQIDFLSNKPLGFDKEQVIYFNFADRAFWSKAEAFKNELKKNPSIEYVSFASGIPGNAGYGSTAKVDNGTREFEIRHIMHDEDYMDLFGFELVDGRALDFELSTDKNAGYLINETAAKQIGWDDPIGKDLELWSKKGQVVGVLKDFHFESTKMPIGPMAFHIDSRYRIVSIKLATKDFAETIDFIEKEWNAMIPDRPFQFQFLDSRFKEYFEEERRFGGIMDAATLLGLTLAFSGLFGLMAFLINKRAKEISIRKVLGANLKNVLQLFLGKMVLISLIAVVIAVPVAYWGLSDWLGGFAYHVELTGLSFLLALGIMMSIILIVVSGQVTRSTSKNPVDNLRYE